MVTSPAGVEAEVQEGVHLGKVGLDLAVANAPFPNGAVSVLLGNGDGSFQTPRTLPAGSLPSSVVVGDVNGDGHLDLAVANSGSGNVSVFLGNGDGSFKTARNVPTG